MKIGLLDTVALTASHQVQNALHLVREANMCILKISFEEETDGRWIAEIEDIPGAMAYGSTKEEAKRKAQAIALHALAERIEHGEDTPGLDNIAFADAV